MSHKILSILLSLLPIWTFAQVVEMTPADPKAGQPLTLTFDLTKCTAQKGSLIDFEGPIYAHMGLVTSESPTGTEWKARIALWPDKAPAAGQNCNIDQVKLTKVGNNLWQLKLEPGVKQFFELYSQETPKYQFGATEQILRLEVVLRNADGSKDGRATGDNKKNIVVGIHPDDSTVEDPLPAGIHYGINYQDVNSVTLALYAPGKKFVYLVSELSNWQESSEYLMKKSGDVFWIKLNNLTPQKEYAYYYAVDSEFGIADPYSNKILERKFDGGISSMAYPNLMTFPSACKEDIVSIFQTNKSAYNWQVPSFKGVRQDKLTIYELLLRDFTRNGSYNGNLKLALEKLDYLKSMGINAIELMPFIKIDGITNWGYHSTFFFATEKVYGTEEDYKQFIDECHKRGIAVIMDIVLDHAYGTCSLVRLYGNPPGNTKAQPAANNPWFNIISPNTSYSWGADFNHESPQTQALVDSICLFWLKEYKLDGFRFDFSKGLTNTPGEGTPYDAARIRIIKRIADKIWQYKPETYLILEHFCDNTEEKELAEYGLMLWGKQFSPFSNAINGIQTGSGFSGAMASSRGWSKNNRVAFMESHDEERVAYAAISKGTGSISTDLDIRMQRCGLAAAFLFLTPGPKMMWEFGEMGYDLSLLSKEGSSELVSGNEGETKPPHWEYLNVASRSNLRNTYQKILNFRNSYAQVLSDGTYSGAIETTDWPVRRIQIVHPDLSFVLIGNFATSASLAVPNFPSGGTWYDLFTGAVANNAPFMLSANEFRLYINKQVQLPTQIKPVETESPVIYPNPAIDQVFIGGPQAKSVRILSLDGKTQMNLPVSNNRFNVASLPKGLYLIQLSLNNGKTILTKLIKN